MHPTTTELFTETIEKTGFWLQELMGELGTTHPQKAYSVLRAVLHTLRDRLTVGEAANLGAQLPTLVRGFYYEGWRPTGHAPKIRHKEEFLQHVKQLYPGLSDEDRERAVRAVFRLLAGHVTGGELRQVKDQLPAEIRSLWESPS
jgi:uncharacterized protein (DUF2267 family)